MAIINEDGTLGILDSGLVAIADENGDCPECCGGGTCKVHFCEIDSSHPDAVEADCSCDQVLNPFTIDYCEGHQQVVAQAGQNQGDSAEINGCWRGLDGLTFSGSATGSTESGSAFIRHSVLDFKIGQCGQSLPSEPSILFVQRFNGGGFGGGGIRVFGGDNGQLTGSPTNHPDPWSVQVDGSLQIVSNSGSTLTARITGSVVISAVNNVTFPLDYEIRMTAQCCIGIYVLVDNPNGLSITDTASGSIQSQTTAQRLCPDDGPSLESSVYSQMFNGMMGDVFDPASSNPGSMMAQMIREAGLE